MGIKNYLVEGISGTGKTAVAEELQRRGYHVIHGDRELKYRGNPKTGEPLTEPNHKNETDKAVWRQTHLLWDIEKVKSVVSDRSYPLSFFCGSSRNFESFVNLLDGVFILNVDDINEIYRRMDERVALDPTDFGGKPEEKELVAKLHATKEDIPKDGIIIDATAPIKTIVDLILEKTKS
jgi:thymidylate kinase